MTVLTDRQAAVLRYIRDYNDVRRKPPTVREIQIQFGLASPNSVSSFLAAIEKKGYIRRVPGEHRNIEVLSKCTSMAEKRLHVE